jgi:antitoxin MazE
MTVKAKIARWGNSLGVRIPRDIAGRVGLSEGSSVEIEARNDRIVLSRAKPRYRLDDLLSGMTPRAMRTAFDWGPEKGREVIEE